MKELFFSLISRKLFIALLVDGVVTKVICEDNYRRHSENFILKIQEVFDKASFTISQVDKIFFLTGPGGQTGERVSLSFALGSLLSKPTVEVFSIDSLTFQAAAFKKCLSVVSTGDRSRKYHFAIYQNGKGYLKKEASSEEDFAKVKRKFPGLVVKIDLEETDFLHNFFICRENFKVFKGG